MGRGNVRQEPGAGGSFVEHRGDGREGARWREGKGRKNQRKIARARERRARGKRGERVCKKARVRDSAGVE